jgi:hypothetical protein
LTSKRLNHRVLSLPLGCPRRVLRRPGANSSALLHYTPRLARAWDSVSLPQALQVIPGHTWSYLMRDTPVLKDLREDVGPVAHQTIHAVAQQSLH